MTRIARKLSAGRGFLATGAPDGTDCCKERRGELGERGEGRGGERGRGGWPSASEGTGLAGVTPTDIEGRLMAGIGPGDRGVPTQPALPLPLCVGLNEIQE